MWKETIENKMSAETWAEEVKTDFRVICLIKDNKEMQ